MTGETKREPSKGYPKASQCVLNRSPVSGMWSDFLVEMGFSDKTASTAADPLPIFCDGMRWRN